MLTPAAKLVRHGSGSDRPGSCEQATCSNLASKVILLAQGIKKPELRDELYMQLLKQSRGNCTASSALAWELFYLVASAMPPSKDFVGLISEYVHTVRAGKALPSRGASLNGYAPD